MPKTKIFFVALLFIFIITQSAFAFAQTSTGPGVDLIILIDQSNSMISGYQYEAPDGSRISISATDPAKRRIETAKYLIEYMAFDNSYVNRNRTNRVLVIGFGDPDKTHVMVPLTSVKTKEAVEDAKSKLASEPLNATSFIAAFKLISEQFPEPTSDADLINALRRRVIVVITDGGPSLTGTGFDSNEEYFQNLQELYEQELGADNYPTYVVGIDVNKPPAYWDQVGPLWESHITGPGNAVMVTDPDEINKQVVKMLCPFLNLAGTESECKLQDIGDHLILPYAQSVSFSFFKYQPDAKIDLYRPTLSGETGGEMVAPRQDPDVLEYTTTLNDEFYGISDPLPGCWLSERRGAGKVDVFTHIVFNDMLMTKPTNAHALVSPLDFEFALRDEKGNPIEELGDFPITLKAKLLDPQGRQQSFQIVRTVPGLYASQQSLSTIMTGTYELVLAGTTTIPSLKNCISSTTTATVFSQTFQIPVYFPEMTVNELPGYYYNYHPLKNFSVQFIDKNVSMPVPVNTQFTADLTVESPTGQKWDFESVPSNGQGFQTNTALALPDSGIYTITAQIHNSTDRAGYKAKTYLEVLDGAEVLYPGPNYPAYAPLRMIEIKLRDQSGQAAIADPDYPLSIEATMIWPQDSLSETVALKPSSEPGLYVAATNWTLTDVKPHILEIKGYTSLLPGEQQELIFVTRNTINVSGNLPFYQVMIPDEQHPGQRYPLHHWFLPPLPVDFTNQPQLVQVNLRYGNQPAKVQDFFSSDPNALFYVSVVDAMGQVIVKDRPLTVSGESSTFTAELPELKTPGLYTATVTLQGQMRAGIPSQGAWIDSQISFYRRDSLIYLIVWAVIGLAAIGAILYFGGGYILNCFILPKAKGTIIIETTGVSPQTITKWEVTPRQRNHFTLKEREIDARLRLTSVKISRAEPQQRHVAGSGKQLLESVHIVASNEKGVVIADENIYKSHNMNSRQKTTDGAFYRFRYEEN